MKMFKLITKLMASFKIEKKLETLFQKRLPVDFVNLKSTHF